MKKQIIFISILIIPFLVMIITNEIIRVKSDVKGYTRKGVTAINTGKRMVDKCTWACHENTAYCKINHVKLVRPYLAKIDPCYFGIIKILKSTGNYGLANIILFAIVVPAVMYLLLINSISKEIKIRKWKKL